ncbi:MAG: hypothetical protein IMHGJWDQ_001523 [Candidatus Fervidibacter sp.]
MRCRLGKSGYSLHVYPPEEGQTCKYAEGYRKVASFPLLPSRKPESVDRRKDATQSKTSDPCNGLKEGQESHLGRSQERPRVTKKAQTAQPLRQKPTSTDANRPPSVYTLPKQKPCQCTEQHSKQTLPEKQNDESEERPHFHSGNRDGGERSKVSNGWHEPVIGKPVINPSEKQGQKEGEATVGCLECGKERCQGEPRNKEGGRDEKG